MIEKVGIDIVENKRIKLSDNFVQKVLSPIEIKTFEQFNKPRQLEFLAGRWAVKEAIIKTLDKKIPMSAIIISYRNEQPVIENKDLQNIHISISHEKKYSIGMAVREND